MILLIAYSRGDLGNMWFKLYTLYWIVMITLIVLLASSIITFVPLKLKNTYILIIVYLISHLLATLFLALPDPNKIGIFANAITLYRDKQIWFGYDLPYLISIVVTICYFNYNTKKSSTLTH